MNDKNRKLLEEELKMIEEADRIIEEVNNDSDVVNKNLPEEIREKIFREIRAYENVKAALEKERIWEEDKELVRLRKLYKKRRRLNLYLIAAAALVLVMGSCVTSMGGTKKVLREVRWWLAGREQTNVDTDSDRVEKQEVVSEIEVYEQIEKEFGFYPVKLYYLPECMVFTESYLNTSLQSAQMIYEDRNEGIIKYRINSNYRTSSSGSDVEDKLIKEYDKEIKGTIVKAKQYLVEETGAKKWNIKFAYQDVQYTLVISGLEENEVEKIMQNLYFS